MRDPYELFRDGRQLESSLLTLGMKDGAKLVHEMNEALCDYEAKKNFTLYYDWETKFENLRRER